MHIDFDQAIPIAALGLGVNFLRAWLLRDDPDHSHDQAHEHSHGRAHDHHHEGPSGHRSDLNMRAAFVHVLADAAVSIFAIVGLLAGRLFGSNGWILSWASSACS